MTRELSRDRWLLLVIMTVTVGGMTAGIAWLAVTNNGVAWQPACLAVALGAVMAVWLLRQREHEQQNRGGDTPLSLSQRLLIGAAAGTVPLSSLLPVSWQIAVLTFVDTYLALLLITMVGRLRRE